MRIWPAQHDSNVRPKPLEEFVTAGICIDLNELEHQKNNRII